ncbi:MAG TPA: hypothetical protein VIM10_14100 [Actinopolymorphaceae bacterium]
MTRPARTPPSTLLAAMVAATLLVSGCSSSTQSARSGTMPRTGSSPTTSVGPGMMGADPGYHYSRLTCSAPRSLPGSTVTVTLGDMGMSRMMSGTAPVGSRMMLRGTPTAVPAGKVSLVALNMGWRVHELVILPLRSGQSAGQRIPGTDGEVSEVGSLGEASASCAGGHGDGIAAGAVSWTTVTLKAGGYELICNLANHYSGGMHQELVVT